MYIMHVHVPTNMYMYIAYMYMHLHGAELNVLAIITGVKS